MRAKWSQNRVEAGQLPHVAGLHEAFQRRGVRDEGVGLQGCVHGGVQGGGRRPTAEGISVLHMTPHTAEKGGKVEGSAHVNGRAGRRGENADDGCEPQDGLGHWTSK